LLHSRKNRKVVLGQNSYWETDEGYLIPEDQLPGEGTLSNHRSSRVEFAELAGSKAQISFMLLRTQKSISLVADHFDCLASNTLIRLGSVGKVEAGPGEVLRLLRGNFGFLRAYGGNWEYTMCRILENSWRVENDSLCLSVLGETECKKNWRTLTGKVYEIKDGVMISREENLAYQTSHPWLPNFSSLRQFPLPTDRLFGSAKTSIVYSQSLSWKTVGILVACSLMSLCLAIMLRPICRAASTWCVRPNNHKKREAEEETPERASLADSLSSA